MHPMHMKESHANTINLDFDALRNLGHLGPRRAAAFTALSCRFLDGPTPNSLKDEKSLFQLQMWSEPFHGDQKSETLKEYRRWIISKAMQELDACLSIFLDECFTFIQYSKMHRKIISSEEKIASISNKTNVAEKYKIVAQEIDQYSGQIILDNTYLVKFSEARNAIAHNLGFVDQRRAPDGAFTIQWLQFRLSFHFDNGEIVFLDEQEPGYKTPAESTIKASLEETERSFKLGEYIELSEQELACISFLYLQLSDRLYALVYNYVNQKLDDDNHSTK